MRVKLLSIFILVVLVGCSAFPFRPGAISPTAATMPAESQSPPTIVPSESPGSISPTETATNSTATPTGNSVVLQVWLPPEFDPNANEIASGYLKARLDEFVSANPGVSLEIRIKALEGPGGMLESLVAANAAAPKALPDLVLMPRPLLESAALKGLLFPYDGLTNIMDDQNWFEYARQLAHINTSIYGIPFAGDAMVLAHRLTLLGVSPHNLETTISLGEVMLYAAADPQALFTISLYLASGGSVQDSQGRPMLDVAGVTQILEYDKRASLAGVMPVTLTEYTNDAQVWEIFKGNAYPMAISWASIYLSDQLTPQDDVTLAPIPTPDGLPFTLATGWGWVLTGKDEARRTLSVRLAEFLVDKEFLAKWTSAAGYLPPRVDALQNWQESETRQVIEQISYSAWLLPPEDLVSNIGPALEQAVVNVIKAQIEPQAAAQAAVNLVNQP